MFAALAGYGVPMTHFGVNTGELLGAMGEAGATVVGVDWRTSLADAGRADRAGRAAGQFGSGGAAGRLAGDRESGLRRRRRRPVGRRRGAVGHIFNLGHGVPAQTDWNCSPTWSAWCTRCDRRRADPCPLSAAVFRLTAAYRIRTAVGPQPEILLFDPADRLGGVLRTETVYGQPFDIGAEAFIVRRPEVPALLAETRPGRPADRPDRGEDHDLQPGPVASVAERHAQRHSGFGRADGRPGGRGDGRPHRRGTTPADAVGSRIDAAVVTS